MDGLEAQTDSIGRITTGSIVSNYTDSSISLPSGIAPGRDGAVWFTNYGNNSIGRIQALALPTTFDQCTNGRWKNFGFRNEGECISSVAARGRRPAH